MTANQEEISDHETFQLEYDPTIQRWYLRTMQDKYFTLGAGGGIQANEAKRLEELVLVDLRLILELCWQKLWQLSRSNFLAYLLVRSSFYESPVQFQSLSI